MSFKALCSLVIGAILFLSVVPVMAADFPSRAVTYLCPYTPGGGTDAIMRVLAETTTKYLGQPVIVENKPGGGGTVAGATMAATAKPDGYTVAMLTINTFRYPHMMKVTWNPLKDFTYILNVIGINLGVVVRTDAPWKNWDEFVAYAKANPRKVTYSSTGAGTNSHVVMEQFALKQGIKWTHVPMKSGGEINAAVLGGHITAGADGTSWAPMVDSGQFRLLVTFGIQRMKKWPQVPTLKELGYDIVAMTPQGIAGPRGMDPKVVKILHDAFKKGMEEQAFRNVLDKFDMVWYYKSPEEYLKYAQETYEEERILVEKLGLKLE
jgi:tripartite-type tricarboxylate transporter receptor subunit TctC